MKKIKMIKTELGADCHDDGRSHGVKTYFEGVEYEVGDRLANDLCGLSVAKLVGQEPAPEAAQGLKKKGAPETKAI